MHEDATPHHQHESAELDHAFSARLLKQPQRCQPLSQYLHTENCKLESGADGLLANEGLQTLAWQCDPSFGFRIIAGSDSSCLQPVLKAQVSGTFIYRYLARNKIQVVAACSYK